MDALPYYKWQDQIFEVTIEEVWANRVRLPHIFESPREPGLYAIYDEDGCAYVGSANNIRRRVYGDHNIDAGRIADRYVPMQGLRYVEYCVLHPSLLGIYESRLIALLKPLYNRAKHSSRKGGKKVLEQ